MARVKQERTSHGLKLSEGDEGRTLLSTFIDLCPNPNAWGVKDIIKPECFKMDVTYNVEINSVKRTFDTKEALNEFFLSRTFAGDDNFNVTVDGSEFSFIWNPDFNTSTPFCDCVNPEVNEASWVWLHTYTLKDPHQFLHFWTEWVSYRDQICYY